MHGKARPRTELHVNAAAARSDRGCPAAANASGATDAGQDRRTTASSSLRLSGRADWELEYSSTVQRARYLLHGAGLVDLPAVMFVCAGDDGWAGTGIRSLAWAVPVCGWFSSLHRSIMLPMMRECWLYRRCVQMGISTRSAFPLSQRCPRRRRRHAPAPRSLSVARAALNALEIAEVHPWCCMLKRR